MEPPRRANSLRRKGGGQPFPRRIRLDREAYREWNVTFHLTIDAHPAISRFSNGLCDDIWQSVMRQRVAGDIQLVAACLMPNHLHLLVRRGRLDIIEFLDEWKSWTTRLGWRHGLRGALWQPGMWDRTVRGEHDFTAVHDYIVRNPVTAGFVADSLEWPWTWSMLWEQ